MQTSWKEVQLIRFAVFSLVDSAFLNVHAKMVQPEGTVDNRSLRPALLYQIDVPPADQVVGGQPK